MTKEEEDWTNFENWSNLGLNPISVNKAALNPRLVEVKPFGLGRGKTCERSRVKTNTRERSGVKTHGYRIAPFGLGRGKSCERSRVKTNTRERSGVKTHGYRIAPFGLGRGKSCERSRVKTNTRVGSKGVKPKISRSKALRAGEGREL